ncbi:MAG: glycosyltransferase family 2 protein [Rhodoferax sp.]|nr:glycosyltransferase family 2 protein [Rhodoferax sp.]
MARTYIVLVNWNGHGDTIECLDSLLRLADDDHRVIVVDNGSTDGSLQHLRDWAAAPPAPVPSGAVWDHFAGAVPRPPDLRVVPMDALDTARPDGARITAIDAGANLGFAGANNLGMRFAGQDPAARYFWVLNNDTVATPESLSQLVAHADRHPQQAIIGAALLYYHDPGIVQGLGGWLDNRRALAGHIGFGLPAKQLPSAGEVQARLAYVMGASMFVRAGTYRAIGGMSEDYFLYYEELDWARRLPQGATLGICLEAVVFHKEGGSIGTSSLHRPSDTCLYYQYASALRFYWKHERRHAPLAAARILYNLVDHARRRDFAAMRITVRAFGDILRGRLRRGAYGSREFIAPAP